MKDINSKRANYIVLAKIDDKFHAPRKTHATPTNDVTREYVTKTLLWDVMSIN